MIMKYNMSTLWDATEAVIRGKLVSVQTYIIEEKRFKINDLSFHNKKVVNKEQIKHKVEKKEIIKKRGKSK